jgi:hypothetical protein
VVTKNENEADIARNASPEGIKNYAKELIPEDGSFSVDSEGYGEFQWYRSVVLDAGVKTQKYNHAALISEEEKEFIKNNVAPTMMDFGKDEQREVYTMRKGRLKELMDDSDSEVSELATKLCEIIEKNPSKLLEDEREILSKIGIDTNSYATYIRVFTKTGRVSVSWQGQTATNEDALTWAKKASPNDETKKRAAMDWLRTQKQE